MKRFFQTIKNIFSIEDLRIRILNTDRISDHIQTWIIISFYLASNQPLLDPARNSKGGIFDLLNTFLGGSFQPRIDLCPGYYALHLGIDHCTAFHHLQYPTFTEASERRRVWTKET